MLRFALQNPRLFSSMLFRLIFRIDWAKVWERLKKFADWFKKIKEGIKKLAKAKELAEWFDKYGGSVGDCYARCYDDPNRMRCISECLKNKGISLEEAIFEMVKIFIPDIAIDNIRECIEKFITENDKLDPKDRKDFTDPEFWEMLLKCLGKEVSEELKEAIREIWEKMKELVK